jgi:hypothetical protein
LNENLDDQENQNLKVKEYDSSFLFYDIDDIDKLMIEELSTTKIISKNIFINNMQKYLDDDFSQEDLNDFNNLIENRLRYFLECKILLIL